MVGFFSSELFTLVVIPILIFLARVIDVSMGTIRVIFISKGNRFYAPILGFFEILIWLTAIQQIMQNLSNIACYFAYAGGFATGTFVGMKIEERLSIGKVILRVITGKNAQALVERLREEDILVTAMDAHGADGPVMILFSVIQRQDVARVVGIVKQYNPTSFYTIEDVRFALENKAPVTRTENLDLYTVFSKTK
jgi:uncharacterized protein YebE (UPF0316 family)